MQPLVSILIPAYNAAPWIRESIESALSQVCLRKEIIILDDGSTDETLVLAKAYCSPTVHVVSQTNGGAAAARNKLLSLSQGDYIQWLDADDLLAPNKVCSQMEAARTRGKMTLLAGPWGSFYHQTSRAKFRPNPLWRDLTPIEWMITKLSDNAHMQTATWLISRELTDKAGLWDTRLGSNDDGEYLSRVMIQCEMVKFVPDAKMFYRITGSDRLSFVGQSRAKAQAHLLGIKLEIEHFLSLENSERTRSACSQRLRTWASNFYSEGDPLTLQAQEVAKSLDHMLTQPKMNWKYSWIEGIWGTTTARDVRRSYNHLKSRALRRWDSLFRERKKNGVTIVSTT